MTSVCTFNVLANCYASTKSFPYCSKETLSWKCRRQCIFTELSDLNSDIILLQEVDQINDFKQYFNDNGYHILYCRRTNKKIDGCLIAWKLNKFVLDSAIYVTNFNDICNQFNEKHNKYQQIAFRKDNISIIIILRHNYKYQSVPLIIANTHFHWNPNLSHVKLLQCATFLRSIEWVIQKHSLQHYHLIIGGDFNSIPTSNVYKFLTQGYINRQLENIDDNKVDSEPMQHENKYKIIVDDGLRKICPWLIWCGVDVLYFSHKHNPTYFATFFKLAKSEKRIIFTVTKNLTQRSNCPKYVLLDAKLSPQQCFKYIIHNLKITVSFSKQDCYDKAVNILLCWICMKILKPIINFNHVDLNALSQHDLNIFTENNARTDIKWHQCVTCNRLLFFKSEFIGRKLQSSINMFYQHVQTIENIDKALIYDLNNNNNNCKMKKKTDVDGTLKQNYVDCSDKSVKVEMIRYNDKVFPSLNEMELQHGLSLKSVYSSFYGNEPLATNYTKDFVGCLDYIFVSNVKIINVKKIDKCMMLLPNVKYPSDHIPVKVKLEL